MDEIQSHLFKYRELQVQHWLHHEVFTWQWWLLLAALLGGWLIGWVLIDRKRILELLLYFSIISYTVSHLDAIGLRLGFWVYRYHEIPFFNRLFSVDLGTLPVFYTLTYQFFPRWRDYFGVLVLSATIYSFVFEPLFERFDILIYSNWNSVYSFPIYISIGLLMKWLLGRIKYINEMK